MSSLPCSEGNVEWSTSYKDGDLPLVSADHETHEDSELTSSVISEEEGIPAVHTAVSVSLQDEVVNDNSGNV